MRTGATCRQAHRVLQPFSNMTGCNPITLPGSQRPLKELPPGSVDYKHTCHCLYGKTIQNIVFGLPRRRNRQIQQIPTDSDISDTIGTMWHTWQPPLHILNILHKSADFHGRIWRILEILENTEIYAANRCNDVTSYTSSHIKIIKYHHIYHKLSQYMT